MKLFHKFFIALLLISMVPLIIYSIILSKTTGVALKKIIDQSNMQTLNNSINNIDDFYLVLEKKLDVARKIEAQKGMQLGEKNKLMMDAISTDDVLLGIFLVGEKLNVLSGINYVSEPEVSQIDRELIEKSEKLKTVVVGKISYTKENFKPYFNIVYPLNTKPKEYLFLKIKLDTLIKKIKLNIRDEDTTKNIWIIDRYGGFCTTDQKFKNSIEEGKVNPSTVIKKTQVNEYNIMPKNTTITKNGIINIVAISDIQKWFVVYKQSAKESYMPVTNLKLGYTILILMSLGITLLGSVVLAETLTKPINKLISAMEKISDGKWDYITAIKSNDEISKMSSIFNLMVSKVKDMQEEIKKAERLSTIGQMANILGHEIRNPLTAISNAAYLLKIDIPKNNTLDTKALKRIGIIEEEIRATNRIINDMLDFSRTRKPALTKQSINDFLSDIVAEYKVNYEFKINVLKDAPLPDINIDKEEMKQVMRNLMNNALDSVKNSITKELTIQTSIDSIENRQAILISVKDTGCGIPNEVIEKIFEPFFSTKARGTGLGLAVVKRIVEERHNGVIKVESEIDRGTTFKIKLPIE